MKVASRYVHKRASLQVQGPSTGIGNGTTRYIQESVNITQRYVRVCKMWWHIKLPRWGQNSIVARRGPLSRAQRASPLVFEMVFVLLSGRPRYIYPWAIMWPLEKNTELNTNLYKGVRRVFTLESSRLHHFDRFIRQSSLLPPFGSVFSSLGALEIIRGRRRRRLMCYPALVLFPSRQSSPLSTSNMYLLVP